MVLVPPFFISTMSFTKSKFKNYGLGLGLRKAIFPQTMELIEKKPGLISWLEIAPENYIHCGGRQLAMLEEAAKKLPIIPHGLNLSIGTAAAEPDQNLWAGMKELFELINPPWFSDHISVTRIDGKYLHELVPVRPSFQAAEIISDNIKKLKDEFQLEFLIENPSYYMDFSEAELSEADFINLILDKADCGLLLDINNVYVNSINHNYDPYKFLDQINLERAVQVHIAGHYKNYQASLSGEKLEILDTHGETICPEVYQLHAELLSRTEIKATLLERDGNFPNDFSELENELSQLKKIADNTQRKKSQQQILIKTKTKQNTDLFTEQEEIKKYFFGEKSKLSETDIRKLSIYKSLVLSSIYSLLENSYPLCWKLLKAQNYDLKKLTLLYIENFSCHSSIFNEAGARFSEYLSSEIFKQNFSETPDFLNELATYEWAERELSRMKNPINPEQPAHKICKFQHPISEISRELRNGKVDWGKIEKQEETIVFAREADTFKVRNFKVDLPKEAEIV